MVRYWNEKEVWVSAGSGMSGATKGENDFLGRSKCFS
jgi:hypothetical protein